MRKCIGCNEKGFPQADHDFGTDGNGEVVGMLISHAGDLLISGPDAFIAYFLGRCEMGTLL